MQARPEPVASRPALVRARRAAQEGCRRRLEVAERPRIEARDKVRREVRDERRVEIGFGEFRRNVVEANYDEGLADLDYDSYVGAGREHLDPADVQAELDELAKRRPSLRPL